MAEKLAGLNKNETVKTVYSAGDTVTLAGETCGYGRVTSDKKKAILFLPIKTDDSVTSVTMSYTGTAYSSSAQGASSISSNAITRPNCEQLRIEATLSSQASTGGVAATGYYNNLVLTFS